MSLHKSIEQILEEAKVIDILTLPVKVVTISADATISEAISVSLQVVEGSNLVDPVNKRNLECSC